MKKLIFFKVIVLFFIIALLVFLFQEIKNLYFSHPLRFLQFYTFFLVGIQDLFRNKESFSENKFGFLFSLIMISLSFVILFIH